MSNHPFKKFIGKKSNAAIKEKFKQEKKAAKRQRAADIEKHFSEKRAKKERERERATEKRVTPVKAFSKQPAKQDESLMPLNKYLAHCGIASRREAVDIIKEGRVKVNGKLIIEPPFKVSVKDEVVFNGKRVFPTNNLVYILLNKPKDYITTTSDPEERKTVLQLIRAATNERVYPVGRLDRNTSGVLLMTNDGDLTQQLTHPSYNIKKIYEAKLDKPLTKHHFTRILEGITLDDGAIHADALAYADEQDKSIIGIEMHSGRNRIVRRIFEHLGYDVKSLDRVMYAGLTKKNVERGKWRFLNEKEIRNLKHLSKKPKPVKP